MRNVVSLKRTFYGLKKEWKMPLQIYKMDVEEQEMTKIGEYGQIVGLFSGFHFEDSALIFYSIGVEARGHVWKRVTLG